MQLERERGIPGKVKFVVFEDERAKNWRVQAVPLTAVRKEGRRSFFFIFFFQLFFF